MERTFWKIARILLFILFIILSLITISMLLLKITGHSPDALTIISWVTGIILTFQVLIITILFQLRGEVSELKEFKRNQLEFNKQTANKIKDLSD